MKGDQVNDLKQNAFIIFEQLFNQKLILSYNYANENVFEYKKSMFDIHSLDSISLFFL